MANAIIIIILAILVGAAVRYLVKVKKRGGGCVGCPSGGCCGHQSSCSIDRETCESGCCAEKDKYLEQ